MESVIYYTIGFIVGSAAGYGIAWIIGYWIARRIISEGKINGLDRNRDDDWSRNRDDGDGIGGG